MLTKSVKRLIPHCEEPWRGGNPVLERQLLLDRFVPRDDAKGYPQRQAPIRHCVHGRSLFSKLFL